MVPRNKPCPCGSGKKNKYCCGTGETPGGGQLRNTVMQHVRGGDGRDSVAPAHAEVLTEQGNAHAQQGRLAEAIACYERALALNPHYVGALNNLGLVLKGTGQIDKAIACYQRTLDQITPVYARAHNNLAIALKEKGRYQEAVVCYRKALEALPDSPDILANLGTVLSDLKKYRDAIPYFKKVLAIAPDFEIHSILGYCLQMTGNFTEALINFQRSLSNRPGQSAVLLNMSACFTGQGKIAEAYDCLQRVISAEPQNLKAYSGLLLTQYYDMSIQLNEIFAAARRFADRFEDPLRGEWPETGSTWHAGRPIRVGVVSADLRNHSVGFFLEGVLRKLDRKSLVLVAYVSQEADDALSERIKPFFEEWLNVRNLSDAQLADRISGDNIDLLLDLSGHTLDNRLLTFARKPAPVQVTWLGYPGTTGLESMDFIIADAVTIPPNEERFYTEKVWRLPETYICFTPPDLNLPVANLPSLERPCFTFGCFNNPAKINDSVVACWAEILNAVPGSELLLKNRNFEHEAERELFRQRFILHGIDSARLCFEGYLDQEDHYAAYHRIDMALDPFPYNGVTTTCEALWMGVPSLTLRMERGMFGHNGEMIMKSVGLEDWVAGSIDDYRGRAVAFASNPAWLASLRITLRQALLSSPLCATERFARNLEDAFRGMVLKSECTSIQGRS